MPTNPNRAFRDRDLPVVRHDSLMTQIQNDEIISYMIVNGLMWQDFIKPAIGRFLHRAELTFTQAEKVICYLEETYDES